MRILQPPIRTIYKTIVVLWMTLSIASVVLAAVTWLQLSHELSTARDAISLREVLDAILSSLVDAENGERGYVLTGNAAFLEPLNRGEAALPAQFERLVGLAQGDATMLTRVMELRAQAEVCIRFFDQVVQVREAQGFDKAAKLIATGEARKVMGSIRTRVAGLRGARLDLVSDGGAAARAKLLRAGLTSMAAGAFGVAAGVIAFWISRLALRQKERERELVEAKLRAEHSNQEKTVFLANASHEIRTPMNAILGFAELLDGEVVDPRHRQYLAHVRSSANSMLQLMNDILDMSKIEAGVLELRPEPTDPREICDFIRTLFAEPAARKGLKLECHVAEDLPRALLIDRIRFRQILVNLVGNAVKFTDRGSIDTRVLWEKQHTSSHITLVIEVEDTGVGIPQDRLDAIFKPFVQAGTHREKEKQGTGLGLAIVKRLAETMGGAVSVASVVGQGSAFHLCFPDVPISARLPQGEKLSTVGEADFNQLQPATVLVVDDNETNCELIAGMFSGAHHRLVFGTNGEEAVAKAREIKPDVVLMDIRMPGMDGRQTLQEIRKLPGLELVPVIAVTASNLMADESELREKFSGYVRKPFSKRELFDEMAQFLRPHTDPKAPAATSPDLDSPAPPETVPPELQAELRRLQAESWPAIRDSVAVNESKAFGRTLDCLGQRWNCQPLVAYGQALIRDGENYAVTDLERHLHDFGRLVDQLAPMVPA